jgi:hypothetical protein
MSAAEVQRFLQGPLAYVKNTCINLQTPSGSLGNAAFNPNLAYDTIYCDLVPWSSSVFGGASQVMLAPQSAAAMNMVAGYYAPYLAFGTIVSNNQNLAPQDNIPAAAPPRRFIFTGGQNGCSFLLLRGTNPGTVCALHYPNSDGKGAGYPLLARIARTAADILLAIDFDLYGETNYPNACSFFYHDGTEWIGVTQPQVQGAPNTQWKRCSMSLHGGPKMVSSRAAGVIP